MKTEKEDLVMELMVHREMDAIAVITEVVTTNKIIAGGAVDICAYPAHAGRGAAGFLRGIPGAESRV